MKDYQLRVIEEKKELDEKLRKLDEFLNGGAILEKTDAELLKRQRSAMFEYSIILGARIQRFK